MKWVEQASSSLRYHEATEARAQVSQVWPQPVGRANLPVKKGERPYRTWLTVMEVQVVYLVINHFARCISSWPYFSVINETQIQCFHKLPNRVKASWPFENSKSQHAIL